MLEQQINQDYIQAMKAKDTARSSALSFLRAQIKNAVIDKRVDHLEDPDVVAILKKQVKQRQDSIEQFTKGGREDLVAKEKNELEILQSYLPAQMPAEELAGIIDAVIKETGATSIQQMGQVMKAVMAQTAGKADNKTVSEMVKAKLAQM